LTTIIPGLVSVVMPNRNHAHYLPTSLDALLSQTWQNLEIIVIDDASSDNSKDVIQQYAARDPRIRPLYVVENLGVNRAVELARACARGEYLCTAAADDFVAPTFFAASVGQLMKFPTAGLCFSDPTEYYEADARSIQYPLYLSSLPAYYDPGALQTLIKRNQFSISSNTIIYRAKAFNNAGGYRTELGWLSDWFVTLVVALRDGACYLPESLTSYRVRADSFSAVMSRNSTAQRQPFDCFLSLLARTEYADVAAAMHAAGILPEYRPRTLFWLYQSNEGRKFLSPHLFKQILYKSAWSLMRPFAPSWFRQQLRKLSSRRTRTREI
jgi:glycosyltransferase involved in cell wall biosynthesis